MRNMLWRHIVHCLYSADFIPSQETSFQGQNKVCLVVPRIGQALVKKGAFATRQPVANGRAVGRLRKGEKKGGENRGNGKVLVPVRFLAESCCKISWVSLALDITKNKFYGLVKSAPKFYWPRPLFLLLNLPTCDGV